MRKNRSFRSESQKKSKLKIGAFVCLIAVLLVGLLLYTGVVHTSIASSDSTLVVSGNTNTNTITKTEESPFVKPFLRGETEDIGESATTAEEKQQRVALQNSLRRSELLQHNAKAQDRLEEVKIHHNEHVTGVQPDGIGMYPFRIWYHCVYLCSLVHHTLIGFTN